MSSTRRGFIKQAAVLSGLGAAGLLNESTSAFLSPTDASSPLQPLDHNSYVAQIHQATLKTASGASTTRC